ncbi:MAG: L-serine ammonia-lyase, iron-sulfur-dependent subunit beta [Firmicutes bacterium]|nr:L-serine ammonia-lyase, iron-sulfur-dependent subunit beta [Bacillota bacterium]
MNIFDLIGPIMVGPSSSHTAGAARIGLVARTMLGEKPVKAEILLHGSFAATGKGHGTDRALVAGLLGMKPDDLRIPDSFRFAREEGLEFSFGEVKLDEAHPNSALLRLTGETGKTLEMIGASVGGGKIEVREINGLKLRFTAEYPTLIIQNHDNPGSIAWVSKLLADENVNIGTFQVTRSSRGKDAIMVIECDSRITDDLVEKIMQNPDIISAGKVNL